MKLPRGNIWLLAYLLCVGVLHADPENFMIEGLTFKRPSPWTWIVPDSDVRKAQLQIWNVNKTKSADVIFYWFPLEDKQGDPDGCVKRWQAQFRERENVQVTIERSKIGEFKVTYAQMEGTYKGFGKEGLSLPDHGLFGAVLQTGKGTIMIRMTGPKEIVSSSGSRFRKMIEDAVKEE